MQLTYGSEKEALEFLRGISDEDRVAVLSHNDADGFVSARIMVEITRPVFAGFIEYSADAIEKRIPEIEKKKINKIIFTDMHLAPFLSEIKQLAQKIHILILDHHECREDLNSRNVTYLKTPTNYCAAFLAYSLAGQIKPIDWMEWLTAAAVVSDYDFRDNEMIVRKVEKKYSLKKRADFDRPYDSSIGEWAKMINNAILYFRGREEKLFQKFEKIKTPEDLKILERYSIEIEKEVIRLRGEFEKNHLEIGDVIYQVARPRLPVASIVVTKISEEHRDRTIIFVSESGKEECKINARRQDGRVNLPEFLKEMLSGIPNSTYGGHIKAAGGRIEKRHLHVFEERLLKREAIKIDAK